jgi:hypothetical protein
MQYRILSNNIVCLCKLVIPISFIGKATYRIVWANTATLVGDIAFSVVETFISAGSIVWSFLFSAQFGRNALVLALWCLYLAYMRHRVCNGSQLAQFLCVIITWQLVYMVQRKSLYILLTLVLSWEYFLELNLLAAAFFLCMENSFFNTHMTHLYWAW